MKKSTVVLTLVIISLARCNCGETTTGGAKDARTGPADATLDSALLDTALLDAARLDAAAPDSAQNDIFGVDQSGQPDILAAVDSSGLDQTTTDGVVTDGHIADLMSVDTNPLVQPLPDFCAGTGAVVSFGEEGICSGNLATQTFRFGLCACEGITVSSQLTIDSFDSALGPYGGTNIGDDGNLGVNQGPLDLTSKITVQGSAFVAGGGMTFGPSSLVSQNLHTGGAIAMSGGSHATIGRNAYIDGDLGNAVTVEGDLYTPAGSTISGTVNGSVINQAIPQILPCPCSPEQILDIAGLTSWAATNNDNSVFTSEDGGYGALDPQLYENGGPDTLTLPCGRFYLTQINQPGGLDIVVTARAVLFVDGNMSTQRFNIAVEPGGELDLFVAGDVTINASAGFGSADAPSSVRTYISGGVSLQASAEFAGNVYAPNADIVFGASSAVYGSLMIRNATFSAAANIHFDSAIRRAGQSCEEPAIDGGVEDASLEDAVGHDLSQPDIAAEDVARPDVAGPDVVSTPGDAASSDIASSDIASSDAASGDAASPYECFGLCSFECGFESCLIEDGQSGGYCGPCGDDLDCCPPFLCDTVRGVCFYPGG